MSQPRVSLIISNRNGARFLPRLIASLHSQIGVTLQIIVVDRHSHDESRTILSEHPEIEIVDEPPETGLVSGYTAGIVKASYPLLAFANEDMYFADDCLRRLADAIDLPRRVAAADPWQWSYDGARRIHGGTRFAARRFDVFGPWPFAHDDPLVDLPAGADVPFANAAALLVDRGVFELVGGWATDFFLDYEDMDLGLRFWQHGWRMVHVPSARVFHAWGGSNAQVLASGSPVSQRRTVSARASAVLMGIKYYSASCALVPLGTWLIRTAANLLRGRVAAFRLELQVAVEIARRVPVALEWRRRHRDQNRRAPGQRFFRHPGFRG